MRGRKSEPAEVKEAKGNPGRRPVTTAPAETLPVLGEAAPRELDAAGRKVWERLTPHLREMRLTRMTDQGLLARYCNDVARYWKLERELRKKDGLVYWTKTNHGEMKRINPAFLIQDRIARRMEGAEDRIGLSPRARQEILARLSADAAAASALRSGAQTHAMAEPVNSDSPLGALGRAAQVH